MRSNVIAMPLEGSKKGKIEKKKNYMYSMTEEDD